jgi:hypothetical protein
MYLVKAEANQIEKIVAMSVRAFETDVNVGGIKGDCPLNMIRQMASTDGPGGAFVSGNDRKRFGRGCHCIPG